MRVSSLIALLAHLPLLLVSATNLKTQVALKAKFQPAPENVLNIRQDPGSVGTNEAGSLLGKPIYLIVSTPQLGKVCWTEVTDVNKARNDKVFPLIDGNLISPRGLAYNKYRGKLYVGDLDGRKIVQYSLALFSDQNGQNELGLNGPPVVIAQNIDVRWLAVDDKDNLYYTDQVSNTVNRIVGQTIQMLESKQIGAHELLTVTAAQLEGEKKARELAAGAPGAIVLPPPLPVPQIEQMFSHKEEPLCSMPSGIATNGEKVFWGNAFNGKKFGAVVDADIDEQAVAAARAANQNVTSIVGNNINIVNGVTATFNRVIYTDVANNIYAVTMNTATMEEPTLLSSNFESPRGAVWDGDGTLYVADSTRNQIYALAVGAQNAQLAEPVVGMQGAFGLALVSPDDPGLPKVPKQLEQTHAQLTLSDFWAGTASLFR